MEFKYTEDGEFKDIAARLLTGQAHDVSEQVQTVLAGKGPLVAGAVLADVVSLWIAGHVMVNDNDPSPENTLKETRELRQHLLTDFIIAVESLIPISAKQIGTPGDPPLDPDHNPFKRS